MSLNFEWDAGKAASNVRKHDVTFEEAMSAFGDPLSVTVADPDHSHREPRLLLLGLSYAGRLLVVSHTERGDSVRIVSARQASRRERTIYEEAEE